MYIYVKIYCINTDNKLIKNKPIMKLIIKLHFLSGNYILFLGSIFTLRQYLQTKKKKKKPNLETQKNLPEKAIFIVP